MKRTVVYIDEEKCDGCGLCVPNCHEGALQVIDGKARLISDLMCDGLGACIGHCPQDAITLEEREAEAYDETRVMEEMLTKGENTVKAHLEHLKEHREEGYLSEGIDCLLKHKEKAGFDVEGLIAEVKGTSGRLAGHVKPLETGHQHKRIGCPGSIHADLRDSRPGMTMSSGLNMPSQLGNWPVQMHLINPDAAQFRGTDLLLAADCVAYAAGNFHQAYLKGKTLAIACPKLDVRREVYLEKLMVMIDQGLVNTLTVIRMEVPCCGGLLQIAQLAVKQAKRKIPVKSMVISLQGDLLEEHWI